MLGNLRVVEIGEGMPVQVAGLLLSELGADVLKIERVGGAHDRKTAAFANWNRGKRSLLLDIETRDGGGEIMAHLAEADVFLHRFSPKRARAMGFDDASLMALNPRLIICGITGSPFNHPDVERSDDELLVSARLGKMYENDGYRPGPIVWRYRSGGWGAAHIAVGGILARLIMRLQSGQGGIAHTSVMQGLLSQLPMVWGRSSAGPMSQLPSYSYDAPRATAQQLWQCQGGDWLQIMDPARQFDYASMPTMWEVLSEGVDLSTEQGNIEAFKRRPLAAWLSDLRAADIAAEPAYPFGALLSHPEAEANGFVVSIDDPDMGPTVQPNTPFHTTAPLRLGYPAPAPGEGGDHPWGARIELLNDGLAPVEPLSGVKVLDFGMFVAGPMAPGLMGDLGANVIKVEPLTGDRVRFMDRYFQAAGRSKRSIALDLTKLEALPILERLVRWADVLHHNLRARGAEKLGLSEDSIRGINPAIVFSYVSAYGQRGACAKLPGYDSIFTALAGIAFENAGEGNPPLFDRQGPMDVLAAQSCFVGTMAALYAARAQGDAWTVQSSLLGVATLVQGELLLREDGSLTETSHLNRDQTGFSPYHRIYECQDREWIAVAAHKPGERALLHAILGADEDAMQTASRSRSASQLFGELEVAGVPCDRVIFDNAMNRFFDDPVNRAINLVSVLDQPLYGTIEQPGALWFFDDARIEFKRPCPTIGQHTDEIMREIGFSEAEIANYRSQGIIV